MLPSAEACTPENVALLLQELRKLEQERDAAIQRRAALEQWIKDIAMLAGCTGWSGTDVQPAQMYLHDVAVRHKRGGADHLARQLEAVERDRDQRHESAEHYREKAQHRGEVLDALRALATKSDPKLVRFSGQDLLDILEALDGR